MNAGEFKHPVLVWAIGDEEFSDTLETRFNHGEMTDADREELRQIQDSREMNLDTDAPPGIHDFVMDCVQPHEPCHGIVVEDDGRFNPHLTAHAIYVAQAKLERPNVEHIFIEEIRWDQEQQLFTVGLGS